MTERTSKPEIVRKVWIAIKKLNSEKSPTNLKNMLLLLSNEKTIAAENLENELMKAVDDELLVNSNQASTTARIIFQIPKLDKTCTLESNCDWYCYFCHTSDNVVKCARCPRVVHSKCERYDDEETEESPPEPNTSVTDSTNSIHNASIISSRQSSIFNGDVCIDDSWLPFVVLKKEPFKIEETEVDEIKPVIADDCQFISVVRQPAKRKARDIKDNIVLIQSETPNLDDNPIEESVGLNLINSNEIICQNCKILSTSDKNQAPNVSVSDLNSLLGFLYERIKPWINFAASASSKSFSKDLQESFTFLFLKFPVTLDSIKSKLSTNMYKTLDEFYCDILDFHHCVAIMYGINSKEYYTSQQTVLECSYHISEIRACHDCYRHSNQLQNQTKFWFTEPCTIRHELVFAKQVGFSYWPAKVLKVVNDDYDVRFFGPKHTRAIVHANYIKSIDTSLEELKISKKSTGFVKAMRELEIYQQRRLNNFNGSTSFQLNDSTISNYSTSQIILDTSLSDSINISSAVKSSNNSQSISKTNLRSRNKNKTETSATNIISINGQRKVVRSPPILVLNIENLDKTSKNKLINIDKNCKITLDNIKTELNSIPMGIEIRKQLLRKVEQEVENLNVDFKALLRQVKKGEWCYVCGKIGKYYCCYSTFYCSSECQHKHWNEEHANNCRKNIEAGNL